MPEVAVQQGVGKARRLLKKISKTIGAVLAEWPSCRVLYGELKRPPRRAEAPMTEAPRDARPPPVSNPPADLPKAFKAIMFEVQGAAGQRPYRR